MILHITTGTLGYLTDLDEKHPFMMMNAAGQDAMLYSEDEEIESIFKSSTEYDILYSSGTLSREHTVSVHYVPISGSSNASIRSHFSDLDQKLQNIKGLIAYRIGHAVHSDAYVVFMQWPDKSTITDFKDTDVYTDYLTPDALKRFRDAGSLFHSFISTKIYLPVEENQKNLDEIPEEEREDY